MKKILIGLAALWVICAIWFLASTFASKPTEVDPTKNSTQVQAISLPDASEVENRINAFRSEKGLSQLADSPALDQAAAARADGMCATNDWSHAQDWATLAPYYKYSYAGENLYFGYLQKEQAAAAVRDWLNSPTHRANIEGNYTEFGIAVKKCPGFQNEPTAIIITNYFGVPQ